MPRSKRPCHKCGRPAWSRSDPSVCLACSREDTQARFWKKVRRGEGCWEWTGYRQSPVYGGHGLFRRGDGRVGMHGAHRASWEIHNGPVPTGLFVLHRCDNPPCVRPDHLFLGTQSDNVRDMDAKGRRRVRPLHGEANPSARLTEALVLELRERNKGGEGYRRLARAFGISTATVQDAVSGRTWRHVASRPPEGDAS